MIADLSLFIAGVEWIIILFFGLILLLGADRLPKVSRSLGKAVGEFQRARKEMENEITRVNRPINIPINGPVASEREKLEAIAKALDIDTEGKTEEDLKKLISDRVNPKTNKN